MTKTAKLLIALVAILFVVGACSSDDGETIEDPVLPTEAAAEDSSEAPTTETATSEVPTTESATSEVTTDVSAAEEGTGDVGPVAVTAVSFTNSTVTIRNDGAEAIDFSGFAICNRPNYGSMPDTSVEPGATLDVDVSGLDIRASGGEFGLYRSNTFDSAEEMVAYVQWGAGDNGRSSVAVEAGLIDEGEFVANDGEDIDLG